MQLKIVLLLFSLKFSNILTQSTKNQPVDSAIDDTPSPEWIKYQQERFQNIDTLTPTYRETLKSINKPKELVVAAENNVHSKMETTSRQESSHQDEDDSVQLSDLENNDAENIKEFVKDKRPSGNTVEFPSIKGFIEFIKSLKHTWMKNSLFRIDDKIKMLHQLKDSLLKTIEQQFMILWQDDHDDEDDGDNVELPENVNSRNMHEKNRNSHLRSKRGILDESNINFPPNAALISINFLTFAVYLIKLVLQVVNIIKTKHYQFSSMNMNMMDTGAIRFG
ncbi:uncharacterized protein LOC119603450 [Lucilia sericata]|uniref:uncharacterized protein LOC119603450 n=1 Tax=Lucilia sericata TaxID=13632 RepID=UPI0018A85100|nr:uncharacterized protein LOC119603450 [Lucilia sericata]